MDGEICAFSLLNYATEACQESEKEKNSTRASLIVACLNATPRNISKQYCTNSALIVRAMFVILICNINE